MPIYEFYCPDCHTVFSFLSRSAASQAAPACPRCARPDLERRASLFAISHGRAESAGDDELGGLDESRVERAMAELAQEAEGINEDDPRQMARLMRKLYHSTGLSLGPGMEEAMRRLESGENPEAIEQEMGDLLEQEEPLIGTPAGGLRALRRKLRAPAVDDTLYEL